MRWLRGSGHLRSKRCLLARVLVVVCQLRTGSTVDVHVMHYFLEPRDTILHMLEDN